MYKIPERMKSKYEFVTLSAKRAEQLQMGAPPRVTLAGTNKYTVVAQAEIAQGLVVRIDSDHETVDPEAEEE